MFAFLWVLTMGTTKYVLTFLTVIKHQTLPRPWLVFPILLLLACLLRNQVRHQKTNYRLSHIPRRNHNLSWIPELTELRGQLRWYNHQQSRLKIRPWARVHSGFSICLIWEICAYFLITSKEYSCYRIGSLCIDGRRQSSCSIFCGLRSDSSLPHRAKVVNPSPHCIFFPIGERLGLEWRHKHDVTEQHSCLGNWIIGRWMGEVLCRPFRNSFMRFFFYSAKVHDVLKSTKCLILKVWHSMQIFYFSC